MAFLDPDDRAIMRFHCAKHLFEMKYLIPPRSNLNTPWGIEANFPFSKASGIPLSSFKNRDINVSYMLVYESILCISRCVFYNQKLCHFKYYLCISRL